MAWRLVPTKFPVFVIVQQFLIFPCAHVSGQMIFECSMSAWLSTHSSESTSWSGRYRHQHELPAWE